MKKLLSTFGAIAGIAAVASATVGSGGASPWSETFSGAPSSPQAWSSPDWDIQYHTRGTSYWLAPEGMGQQHGGNCEAPPMTHPASSWPGSVYQCRDHVMTAINASEYGLIYLTPNRMVDFSGGATIQWDMSTEKRSARDWADLVITPYQYNQATTLISTLSDGVDLQGPPRQAVHIGMDNTEGAPLLGITSNGVNNVYGAGWNTPSLNQGIPSSVNQAATRQTFRLTLTPTSAKFERLASDSAPGLVYWDRSFSALPFTSGVVQFGHHSYTPWKDGNGGPQTYHWDNVQISPSIPFTMIKGDKRYVGGSGGTVNFASPAPANSHLRFSAVGGVEVSLDGGPFTAAQKQWELHDRSEGASSYWHPVPQGTRSVQFRFSARSWYQGPYIAKDFAIWSSSSGGGGSLPIATPTRTSTPVPTATTAPRTTPTATPTTAPRQATPTATPTQRAATSTPTPVAPTATPTATPQSSNQSWTVSATSSSGSIRAGDRVGLTAQAKTSRATTALVDLEVYDPQGRKVFQQYWDRRSFDAYRTRGFSALWRLPRNAQAGTYTVKVGIFGVRWNGMEYWNDSATTFTVR